MATMKRHPPMMRLRRAASLLVVVLTWAPPAARAASAPWTPSTSARHALELLADEAALDLPVSQWPLPRQAVQDAIDALPAPLPERLAAARDVVQAALHRQRRGLATLNAREHADALTGFGQDATPGSSLELRSGEWTGPHLAAQVGVRLDPPGDPSRSGSTLRPDDTALAADAFGVQVQAWAHRTWWGPGWQSALPISNNAPAFQAVGLQRASASRSESKWLSWLGPWNAEFFTARSQGQQRELGSNALISGMRLTFKPFSHVEFGLTKMIQWGGYGHRESLHALADNLLDLHVNAGTTAQRAVDPGNGLAGYDARVTCPFGVRCAAYGQFIGEDEAGHLPTKFLGLLGAEWWSTDGRDRFFLEAVETGCRDSLNRPPIHGCAYRNYQYPGGYTNEQRWIGAGVGPDSHVTTLGWIDADWDSAIRMTVGHVGSRIGVFDPQPYALSTSGRLRSVSAQRSFDWLGARFTPQVDWMHLETPAGVRTDTRVGVAMSVPLP